METEVILETARLILRKLTEKDLPLLERSLCDEKTMYAYEHGFSVQEARQWLFRQLERYERDGCGLWGVETKAEGRFVGQCGITVQDIGGRNVFEIGYVFDRNHWGHGFATEAAKGCRKYGFEVMDKEELFSIIRDNNTPSIGVALRNDMHACGHIVKYYYGMNMPHTVYIITREEYIALFSQK